MFLILNYNMIKIAVVLLFTLALPTLSIHQSFSHGVCSLDAKGLVLSSSDYIKCYPSAAHYNEGYILS